MPAPSARTHRAAAATIEFICNDPRPAAVATCIARLLERGEAARIAAQAETQPREQKETEAR